MAEANIKLLIIDDDEGDRKQIVRSVKRSGLQCGCLEADTIGKALTLLSTERFDCVILDYYLPGENGLRGIRAILEQDEFLPVIMSTGQGNERVASEAIKLGAMDYISKADLNAKTIRTALDSVLTRAKISRELAEQQNSLAVFARVLVHDMKTPTQSILGFAKLVEQFLCKENFDREKVIQQTRRIAEGALRMNALLDELHAYTEADAQPQFENIGFGDLMRGVTANLDALIERRAAQVKHDTAATICGDRAQLTQLLQNLIGNGIKYCQAETPEIHIGVQPGEESRCIVEVRDNGIGIPEKHYKTIFEPFKRLHSQGEFEGTGLGLATCKKIVERHGGTIWCRSEAGAGTSFFFTVPLVENYCSQDPHHIAAE